MAIRITGGWDGFAAFDRAFLKVEHVLGDFRPIFEDLGVAVIEIFQDQFWTAGAGGGTPWEPLSQEYADWKAANSDWGSLVDVSILQLSGDMYRSFTIKGAEGNVWEIERNEARFGSIDRKARWHQTGAGNLPAREILAINDARRTLIMKRAHRKLIQELKETGLVQRTEFF